MNEEKKRWISLEMWLRNIWKIDGGKKQTNIVIAKINGANKENKRRKIFKGKYFRYKKYPQGKW